MIENPSHCNDEHSLVGGGRGSVGDGQLIAAADAGGLQPYGQEMEHDNGAGEGAGEGMEEDQDDGIVERTEGDFPVTQGDLGDLHGVVAVPFLGNQLTLSFQGEVYVFDSVSPEKVQAVLLLLGGREFSTNMSSIASSCDNTLNKPLNFPHRVASLLRFREKRKDRNFDKKIRYTVRKEVALRMQRHRGQFASSKARPDDEVLAITSPDGAERWGSVEGRPPSASNCHHCGITSISTPMMRRGPDGPRTLCNACGLMWANKGTLRDLSKHPAAALHTDASGSNGASVAVEGPQIAVAANGHESSVS